MKESRFVTQNSPKWNDFHKAVTSKEKDPGSLSKLFVQITDDLSFARTFYPNRSIRNYLNALAETIFIQIHRNKKSGFSDFVKFWKTSLPLMNYEARGEFLVSFLVFALAVAIGMLSSAYDQSFPAFILGEDYVDMALKNIEKGDPMSVYKEFLPFNGFLQITLNNLLVASYTFVFGVFSAIGTLFIMLYNGVMVGSFQQFYINQGLFRESFLTIWQHGTMEISSIIISGAAGLTMGKGLLFPGSYSRLLSFSMSARRGVKIFIGIIPPIILAGFIESYLTRYTEIPDPVRLLFIALSLSLMLAYYIWYPRRVARSAAGLKPKSESFDVSPTFDINYGIVYSGGRLFENTMVFFGRHFSKLFKPFAIMAAVSGGVLYFTYGFELLIEPDWWLTPDDDSWMFLFNYNNFPMLFPWMSLMFALVIFICIRLFVKTVAINNLVNMKKVWFRLGAISLILGVVSNFLFFINFWLAYLLMIFLYPLLLTIGFAFVFEKKNLFRAISHGINLHFYRFSISMGLSLKFGVLMILMVFLIMYFLVIFPSLIVGLFDVKDGQYDFIWAVLDIFGFYIGLFLGTGIMACAMGQMYFTVSEILSAENLKKRIEGFGQSKKILGYERE